MSSSSRVEDLKYAKEGDMHGILYVSHKGSDEIFPIFVYTRKDFHFIMESYKHDEQYTIREHIIVNRKPR